MSTNFLNIDPSHLYDPARQSPTLEQKQFYSDWSAANPQAGAQTVTDPTRKAAYDKWLKNPQQLDFEQWYSRQSGTPEQQATWNAADANWQSSPLMPQAPNPGVYKPPTNAMQPAPIPPSPWQTQPKPAEPIRQTAGPALPGSQDTGFAGPGPSSQNTGGFQLPPGFDVKKGSDDPAINHQVYGPDYFPSDQTFRRLMLGFNLPNNSDEFFRLTPEQQGRYREVLANWFSSQRGTNPGGPGPKAGMVCKNLGSYPSR